MSVSRRCKDGSGRSEWKTNWWQKCEIKDVLWLDIKEQSNMKVSGDDEKH